MIKIRMKENDAYSLDGIKTTQFKKGEEYEVPQVVFDCFHGNGTAIKVNPTVEAATENKAVEVATEMKPRKVRKDD